MSGKRAPSPGGGTEPLPLPAGGAESQLPAFWRRRHQTRAPPAAVSAAVHMHVSRAALPARRCGDGPHLVALECTTHGLENLWPQPKMLLFPGGFTPQLGAGQLAEFQAAYDEGESLPDDSRGGS